MRIISQEEFNNMRPVTSSKTVNALASLNPGQILFIPRNEWTHKSDPSQYVGSMLYSKNSPIRGMKFKTTSMHEGYCFTRLE